MSVKFYVGTMSSDYATIHSETVEVHFLTRLDRVLTAYSPEGAAALDKSLRDDCREFIRSDNNVRTFVALDIFNRVS